MADRNMAPPMPAGMPKLDGPIRADHSGSIVVDWPFGIRGGIPLYGQAFAPQAQVLASDDGHPRAVGFISRVPAPTLNGIERIPFYTDMQSLWLNPTQKWSAARLAAARADARKLNVGWVIVWPLTHEKRWIDQWLTGTGFRYDYHEGKIQVYKAVR